jgi:hypothetical protein
MVQVKLFLRNGRIWSVWLGGLLWFLQLNVFFFQVAISTSPCPWIFDIRGYYVICKQS